MELVDWHGCEAITSVGVVASHLAALPCERGKIEGQI